MMRQNKNTLIILALVFIILIAAVIYTYRLSHPSDYIDVKDLKDPLGPEFSRPELGVRG